MKRDKKFLNDLAINLTGIDDETKNAILLKYKKIIVEEKKAKRKISDIIDEFGDPSEIAKNELSYIDKPSLFSRIVNKIKEIEKKDKEQKEKDNEKLVEKINLLKNKLLVNKNKENKHKNDNKESKKNSNKSKKKDNKKSVKKFIFFKNKENKHKRDIKNNIDKSNLVNKVKNDVVSKNDVILDDNKESDVDMSNFNEVSFENRPIDASSVIKKSIILKILWIILISFLLFAWLWSSVVFIASLFALLDGVKIYGISISLFGLNVLILWVVVILNNAIFKIKNIFKLNMTIIISSIFLIAFGIASAAYKIYKTDRVDDASIKYSMTNKSEIYDFPSDSGKKLYLIFNSNYDIQYIVNYDDNYSNKVKVDISYYECYYNYYTKKSSNNIYISLNTNFRDRLSTYISDFKDGYIIDNDELSRYLVKVTVNKNDYERLVIEN